MTENKKPSPRPSKRDPDEAPELTTSWFTGANLYKGKKLVRPEGKRFPENRRKTSKH
ncbi:MAG: hypothetical protein HY245_06035 [Rhizobiales bacterium]|nr:hypothetical protein [Hyphomicrobiales bacterium]MBI3672965.1 hypothetical protein [Hyphomicrobiales bacterium]